MALIKTNSTENLSFSRGSILFALLLSCILDSYLSIENSIFVKMDGLKFTKVDQKLIQRNMQQRQNLIFFTIEPDNSSKENYNSVAMSFLNRFATDENDQFEVYAFHRMTVIPKLEYYDGSNIEKAVQKYAEQSKRDETDKNIVHFIFAADLHVHGENIVETIKNEMAKLGLKKGMVTFLQRQRYHCVTKETYEQLYTQGGILRHERVGKRGLSSQVTDLLGRKVELSFGDDLEDFLNRIKNNQASVHELGPEGEWINTFHLSLLSPEKKRKLANNDQGYFASFHNGYPDVPEKEMIKSESKSKYEFSVCRRVTCIISPEIHLPKNIACLGIWNDLWEMFAKA